MLRRLLNCALPRRPYSWIEHVELDGQVLHWALPTNLTNIISSFILAPCFRNFYRKILPNFVPIGLRVDIPTKLEPELRPAWSIYGEVYFCSHLARLLAFHEWRCRGKYRASEEQFCWIPFFFATTPAFKISVLFRNKKDILRSQTTSEWVEDHVSNGPPPLTLLYGFH